jgi:hypothetical protein
MPLRCLFFRCLPSRLAILSTSKKVREAVVGAAFRGGPSSVENTIHIPAITAVLSAHLCDL